MRAYADADAHGVPAAAYMEAMIESRDADPNVAEAAMHELAAYREGRAIPIPELAAYLTPAAPTLLLRMGGWRDDEDEGPIKRSGIGIAADQWGLQTAPAVQGYWRIAPPRTEEFGDGALVIGLRRGQPRTLAWGKGWTILPGDEDARVPRRYARKAWLIAENGRWIDGTTGEDEGVMDEADAALEGALSELVVLPDGNQNPATWVVK